MWEVVTAFAYIGAAVLVVEGAIGLASLLGVTRKPAVEEDDDWEA